MHAMIFFAPCSFNSLAALHRVPIVTSNIFLNLNIDLSIIEAIDLGLAERNT